MVFREGSWIKIFFKEFVLGDIVKFMSGDRIGVDVWIVEVRSFEIEELVLIGEFILVVKYVDKLKKLDVLFGDIMNMVFMGMIVICGSGVGVVVGIGMNMVMGKIVDMFELVGILLILL